jgi:hypothetical protein
MSHIEFMKFWQNHWSLLLTYPFSSPYYLPHLSIRLIYSLPAMDRLLSELLVCSREHLPACIPAHLLSVFQPAYTCNPPALQNPLS